MSKIKGFAFAIAALAALFATAPRLQATPRKVHTVAMGAAKRVRYSKVSDPAGALPNEQELRIRGLIVDGLLKEWTTGETHDVTDRSFLVRRVIRLNDALPVESVSGKHAQPGGQWAWQRGPWLLVDRVTGHVLVLKLPDYDPGVSQVSWFRDYGAYCGLTANAKNLYAVVAQVTAHKPVLAKKIAAFDPEKHPDPVCSPVQWQREPLQVTFHPNGKDAVSFEIVPGSAVLVEESPDEPDTAEKSK
jgi:hypothetical protein